MSDYTKTTNFATKDALSTGNPGKVAKGVEVDAEFNNIQTAIASKLDTSGDILLSADGTTSAPSRSYENDPDTGEYRDSSGSISFTSNGTTALIIRASTVFPGVNTALLVRSGTPAAPGLSYFDDQNTGLYWDTADQIGITLGGVTAGQIAQGSFTATLTGVSGTPSVTASYQRFGKMVMISIPPMQGTSNSNLMTITGAPAVIRPSGVSATFPVSNIFNNSGTPDDVPYSANMNSSGTINFFRGISGQSGFTASGTKGVSGTNGSSGTMVMYLIT